MVIACFTAASSQRVRAKTDQPGAAVSVNKPCGTIELTRHVNGRDARGCHIHRAKGAGQHHIPRAARGSAIRQGGVKQVRRGVRSSCTRCTRSAQAALLGWHATWPGPAVSGGLPL